LPAAGGNALPPGGNKLQLADPARRNISQAGMAIASPFGK